MMSSQTLTPASKRAPLPSPLKLPGSHRVVKRNGAGTRIYWFAWRGGPQIAVFRGADDAEAAAAEKAGAPALAAHWGDAAYPRPSKTSMAGLIADFRASPAWAGLAPSTRRVWTGPLDDIQHVFGALSLTAMQARGIRARIKKWHGDMAATPRKANMHLQVMVRLLEWGVDEERLARNPARGIAHLKEGKGRAHILWTEAEAKRFLAAAGPAMARNFTILWETGLRREDLVQLTWDEIDFRAGHLVRPTNKSGGRHVACPPITPALAKALKAAPRTHPQVVIGDNGGPYKDGGAFYNSFKHVRARAKIAPGKGVHDIRGTVITRGYAEGLSDIDMEIRMGWAPGQGAAMRAIYGSKEQLARAAAARARPKRKKPAAGS